MECRESPKKSAEGRKDDGGGISLSTLHVMEGKLFSNLTE